MTDCTLILIHRGPEYERDFTEIAAKVTALDPGIRVCLTWPHATRPLPPDIWERPTLTVALLEDYRTIIRRGPVLHNRRISKIDQARIAGDAGVAAPAILPFRFGMGLDPIIFGPLVVLKPMSLTSTGEGVHLMRRTRAQAMTAAHFPAGHPIHRDRHGYLVQRFVDTGRFPIFIRVLTFLGDPIYAAHGALKTPRPDLDSPDAEIENAKIAIQGGSLERAWGADDDALAMARAVGAAFHDAPLLAIDMLREEKTGKLYFLECNPGGNTWHFSSLQAGGLKIRKLLGEAHRHGEERGLELGRRRMITQTGAWDIVAKALARATRRLAR